jgi:Icc-related predicted phosphoesterase
MIVLHTSDLHAQASLALDMMEQEDFDVWIDTGDFFPERTMGIKQVEIPYQLGWWEHHDLGRRFAKLLDGRPALVIAGNHDHVSLTSLLTQAGASAFNVADGPVTIGNHVFAGFAEIPFIAGHWDCETHSFGEPLDRLRRANPTTLLTHAPPWNVLDNDYGIPELTTYLADEPHRIQHHFFGHIHELGGQTQKFYSTICRNGARKALIHYI